MTFTGVDVIDHIIATVIIVVGFFACFCGYRLFRLFLALAGFLFTLLIVFTIIYYFITPNLLIASVVGSLVGIAGALGISYLPALGVFFLGSFFGFISSLLLIASIRANYLQQDDVRDVIMLTMAICSGYLSLRWKKAAVLGGTSMLGSFSVITGVDHWTNSGFSKILDNVLDYNTSQIKLSGVLIGLLVAFVVMLILGVLVQHFITGILDEQDLSVSGQLPVTVPLGARCCNPYIGLFRKKISRDEVPLLDVVTLDD